MATKSEKKGKKGGGETAAFNAWASSAMHITESVFGKESSHYTRFIGEFSRMTHNYIDEHQLNVFRGIFNGAKSDIDGGYVYCND